jgi:hypothetical protein
MKISLQKSKSFAKISGDKNLIHLDKKFTSNFFFSEPIVHGANLAIIALKQKFKKTNLKFDSITFDFKNYVNIDEKFEIIHLKNSIKIQNNVNKKLIITFDKSSKLKFEKKKIYIVLKYISKLVGTKIIGNGAIIFKIKIKSLNVKYFDKKIKIRKINENIKLINIVVENFDIEIICGKSKPFKPKLNKFELNKNIINKIKNKKFLFIGPSSDIAKILINSIKKYSIISKFSFRLESKRKSIKNNFFKLKKILLNNYDYIFYMSSVRILHDDKNNKELFLTYKYIYFDFFKLLVDYISNKKDNCKIFYPSTFALNDKKKFKNIRSYLVAKEKGERLCKKINYKNTVYCPRIPQMKSRSNYNILGFYEGQELFKIKKYLINFINFSRL